MNDVTDKTFTIVITGAGGQLGQELARMSVAPHIRIVGLDRSKLDITDADQCKSVMDELRPDAIIHAAAHTAVDRAEAEPDTARLVNVLGTRNVAIAAEAVGAKFIFVSTDYVFNGKNVTPYSEHDATDPQSVYGRTKLEGEREAAAHCSRLFVVRTSWVYGRYGNNFVKTMLKLAEQRNELKVVQDQVGSPTFTYDLAELLLSLAQTDDYGIYHASNSGICSWYEFAKAIFEEAGLTNIRVIPCNTEEFPRPAPRPAYSVLGNQALIDAGFKPLRHWREALHDYIRSTSKQD
ncbi:dTDP-4-dehydrorhamnose reductase [Cohnella yongneupensis]|uniref:dTDP-4-dehydrorhamnose reductase n=1 Tax=Cohnella yongneupensis TaxID=425006 RepID=A0ABW0QX28_9BACL